MSYNYSLTSYTGGVINIKSLYWALHEFTTEARAATDHDLRRFTLFTVMAEVIIDIYNSGNFYFLFRGSTLLL